MFREERLRPAVLLTGTADAVSDEGVEPVVLVLEVLGAPRRRLGLRVEFHPLTAFLTHPLQQYRDFVWQNGILSERNPAECRTFGNHAGKRIGIHLSSVQVAPIDVGHLVAGKYKLVRLLGKGAMGEVWLAEHDSLGGEFAIKLVRPEAQDADDSAIARFQQEAQVSAKLSRKTRHIVSVSDHGEEEGLSYLVMELLEGESLEARIDRSGALDLPETVAIVTQVARALGQAHAEQIVHRDLKPANVFLTKDEDGQLLVKLLDFGIARAASPTGKRSPFATGKDMVLGTPSYMSPEQARGLPSLDHRCDLWALAVVAYEALTRTIPWHGESIEDIFLSICTHEWTPVLSRRPGLPPELEGFFARAFADTLDARFRTAAELSEAFVALAGPLGADGVAARAPSSPELYVLPSAPRLPEAEAELDDVSDREPTFRTRRRRSSVAWLIAAGLGIATLAILGFAIVSFNAPDKEKSTPPEPASAIVDTKNVPPPSPTPTTTSTTIAPADPTAKATTRPIARPVGAPPSATTVPTHTPPEPPPPVVTPPAPTPPPAATHGPPPVPSGKPDPDKSQVF